MRPRSASRPRVPALLSAVALPSALALLALSATLALPACQAPGAPRARRVPPRHDGAWTTWWNDEQRREQGHYRAGLRHGHVRAWHPDGTPAMEGDFLDGAPDGPQRAWHENGALALEAAYAHGVAHAERREHDEQGTLRRRAHYADGLAHGEEVLYRADGGVERRGRNLRGLPSGPWLEWDADGVLLAETIFLRSGAAVGAVLETAYDADGAPHLQVLRVERDGVWSGRATTWRPDGSLASLAELRDGRHHGVQRTYDATGCVRSEGRSEQGLRTGPWTFRDEAGRIERTVVYEADRVVEERARSDERGGEG